MAMVPTQLNSLNFGNDSAEQSFINYQNGIENLIISRNFTDAETGTVWVIPIPSKPEKIVVDVLDETPRISGVDVIDAAQKNLPKVSRGLLYTQVWTAVPILVVDFMQRLLGIETFSEPTSRGIGAANDSAAISALGINPPVGVTVYSSLTKEGMTAEVLSAVDSEALYTYLNGKNLNVSPGSIPILEDYIGEDFSFVASWVTPAASAGSAKGLFMSFPTSRIFYPLKPESLTPGPGMPETITVMGHVTPELFGALETDTVVKYFQSDKPASVHKFFGENSPKSFNFTKLAITTKPSNLTQDLYFSSLPPLSILHASALARHPIVFAIVFHIVLSVVMMWIVLRILFRKSASQLKQVQLLLLGCAGFVGAIIGVRKYLPKHKVSTVALYSLFYVVFVTVYWIVFHITYAFYAFGG